ncbi:hypothetical protein EYV94_14005 [Puteibacter caeruleilacunae]|nr:hypothetical protein EYV94_14005 [Puteibacter caeruleilacunae]
MRYIVTVVFVMLGVIIAAKAQNTNKYLEDLSSRPSIKEVHTLVDSLFTQGKAVIPLLIKEIDRPDKVFIGLGKPYSSTFAPDFWTDNYRGIRSAYFIEVLLRSNWVFEQNCRFRTEYKKEMNYPKDHNLYKVDFYYIGINNIIDRVDGKLLDHKDMVKIKKLYRKWWKTNKHLTMEEMQEQFGKQSILTDSPYQWI